MSIQPPADFSEIAQLIATAKQRAVQAVNTTLIELYWQIGERISRRIATLGMGRWRGGATGALSGAYPAGAARLHSPQPVQDAAVL